MAKIFTLSTTFIMSHKFYVVFILFHLKVLSHFSVYFFFDTFIVKECAVSFPHIYEFPNFPPVIDIN